MICPPSIPNADLAAPVHLLSSHTANGPLSGTSLDECESGPLCRNIYEWSPPTPVIIARRSFRHFFGIGIFGITCRTLHALRLFLVSTSLSSCPLFSARIDTRSISSHWTFVGTILLQRYSFASTHHGNDLTEDEQWAKIQLCQKVAQEVYGDGK